MSGLLFMVPLPPREVSPNGRFDRHEKAAAISAYRQLVCVEARNAATAAKWVTPAKARVSLLFGLSDQSHADKQLYHPWDADNACASWKAGFDGMTDAMVIETDRWENMELGKVMGAKSVAAGVYVEVEGAQAEYDQLAKEFAVFRGNVRNALFDYWPNNFGVGDSEIITAIDELVEAKLRCVCG